MVLPVFVGYQSKRKGKILSVDNEKSCLEHLNQLVFSSLCFPFHHLFFQFSETGDVD